MQVGLRASLSVPPRRAGLATMYDEVWRSCSAAWGERDVSAWGARLVARTGPSDRQLEIQPSQCARPLWCSVSRCSGRPRQLMTQPSLQQRRVVPRTAEEKEAPSCCVACECVHACKRLSACRCEGKVLQVWRLWPCAGRLQEGRRKGCQQRELFQLWEAWAQGLGVPARHKEGCTGQRTLNWCALTLLRHCVGLLLHYVVAPLCQATLPIGRQPLVGRLGSLRRGLVCGVAACYRHQQGPSRCDGRSVGRPRWARCHCSWQSMHALRLFACRRLGCQSVGEPRSC